MAVRFKHWLTAVAGAASLVATGAAVAQAAFPAKPVTVVVPFSAGGPTDVVARLIGVPMGKALGQTVIIDNALGAGGTIAAAKVARAAPDGSTLLMGTIATHVINPLSMAKPPYNAQTGFTPVSLIATVPNVLMVNSAVKANNVKELIALLKSKPGQLSYGSSGLGTPPHLSGELFKSMAQVDMVHVPYKGGGPAMSDLIGGQIPVLFDVLTGAASHIRGGSARALAVTSRERVASFPNIPTVAESGVPGYETWTWNGIFGPAGMPRPAVDELSRALQAVVAQPEVQAKLKELSATPVGSTPEALATLVKTETDKWRGVIQSMGGLSRE